MISLENVNELNEMTLSYNYVNKKKFRTFLKARQPRINIIRAKRAMRPLWEKAQGLSAPSTAASCRAWR